MADDDLIRRGDALKVADEMFDRLKKKGAAQAAFGAAEVCEAIAALLAVKVGVKPLVWEEEPDRDPNYPKWTADTGMGKHYFVFKAWWGSQQKWGFAGVDGFYHTKDAAKAAAQADYAARIMAAIDVVDVAELTDPVAVHTNMLRWTIAKPTVEQIVHLYGVDALCKALAPVIVREAEAALPAVSAPHPYSLRPDLQKIVDNPKNAPQWDTERDRMAAIDAPDLMQPATVHLNMLRGTIAKPTVEQIIHLYGVDALVKALAPVIVREAGHEPS